MKEILKNYQSKDIIELEDQKKMLIALEEEEGLYTRENVNHHFSVSAWIVDENFQQVLMVYHNIYDSWSWVGGHLDGENDLKKKIVEEIYEETGVRYPIFLSDTILSLEVLDVKEHIKNGEVIKAHQHFDIAYLLQASTSEKICSNQKENKDVRWIKVDELKDWVSEESMLPLYEKLMKRARAYQ